MMDDKDQKIKDLENAIKIQAQAVKNWEAAENRELNRLRVEKFEWLEALRQLESEREMNAILTGAVELLEAAVTQAAADERAKIVAWLREPMDHRCQFTAAAAIEAGEHLTNFAKQRFT